MSVSVAKSISLVENKMDYYNIINQVSIPPIKDRRLKPFSAQKIAAQNGEVYFIGTPCKRNHEGKRYTKGGQCVACMALARNIPIRPRKRSEKNHARSLAAAQEGQTTYIPSKECKHGHLLRYINSNNCVECDKLQIEKHKITLKFLRIKKLYNLSKEQYLNLVKEQNSSCKLCYQSFKDHFQLHIDHCHETNKVRGLLCNKCNQGIGLLQHNSNLLKAAALYCEKI